MSSTLFRQLTSYERRLTNRLLEGGFRGRDAMLEQISNSVVRELDDNGSLEFKTSSGAKVDSKFRIPTEGEFEDDDGITIHVLLHVVDEQVDELEIFKEDHSGVIKMPDPTQIRLFQPE